MAKTGPKAKTLVFIEELIAGSSDECIPWPFCRSQLGRGLMTVNGKMWIAHRYICREVHGEPPENAVAAHECGNGHLGCVNPRHISWKSHKENFEDSVRHKTAYQGPRKLTEDQAIAIKNRFKSGEKCAALGREYGMTDNGIRRIVKGITWKHLP